MADSVLSGIRRLSDAQFETLANGGTVEEETYEDNKIYETPVFETTLSDQFAVESDILTLASPYHVENEGSISTLAITLPTTASLGEMYHYIFTATAAFVATTSGGTVVGDTIPTTVSGKTYEFMFSWNGAAWRFSYLGY